MTAPTAESTPFSFAYYRSMLEAAVSHGYRVSSFARFDTSVRRTIIMRHDVDYTLNGVADLAEIEAGLGLTASYLFRVHAHEYNLFAPHVYKLLTDLRELGHEVGLHFEAKNFARALSLDPWHVLLQEKQFLESILGEPVQTASEHRDVSHVVHQTGYFHDHYDPLRAGFRFYAMDPAFARDMKYLSDSNGIWREGDLFAHLGKHDRYQVLIHPDWWFEKDLLLKGPYFHGLGN